MTPTRGGAPHASPPRIGGWALLATLLVSLPCLFVGFAYDDLEQRLMLAGKFAGASHLWFGLYDFTPPVFPARVEIARGALPWFSDPDLSLRFLRPLSSAGIALDATLFGRSSLLAHAHSLIWMGVLVVAAARLYARWFERWTATWCSLIFALSCVHGISTAWLAARHTLIAATFGVLSLSAWLRFRESEARSARVLAVVALVASLLSSEAGLVTVVMLVSHELCTRGLRRGLATAALPLGIGILYLGAYAALGYGAHHSGFYVSPFDAPVAYVRASLWGVPALATELLLGLPSLASTLGGTTSRLVFAVLGVCALTAALGWAVALRERIPGGARSTLRWLAIGGLLSLFALVGAPVTGRVLIMPMLAGAAILGNALTTTRAAATRHRGWWIPFGLICLLALGLSPLLRLALPFQFASGAESQRRIAETAEVGACAQRGSLYLLNASDPSLALYASSAIAFHTPRKAGAERFRVLSMAFESQRLTRVGPRTLELEVLGGARQENPFERLFRGISRPLEPGQRIELPELGIRVEATNQGRFTRARFEFRVDPEQLPACLLRWRHGRLEGLPWPALGHSQIIAHEPGPMGM